MADTVQPFLSSTDTSCKLKQTHSGQLGRGKWILNWGLLRLAAAGYHC